MNEESGEWKYVHEEPPVSQLPVDIQMDKGSADPDNSVLAKLANEEEKEPVIQEEDNTRKIDEKVEVKLKNE